MATATAAMSGVAFVLQAATTTGNGNIVAPPASFRHHNITITGAGTVSTGAVTIEGSNDPNDSGTWSQLASPVTVVSGSDLLTQLSGIFPFIRARISTNITGAGGSVTVTYVGAKSY